MGHWNVLGAASGEISGALGECRGRKHLAVLLVDVETVRFHHQGLRSGAGDVQQDLPATELSVSQVVLGREESQSEISGPTLPLYPGRRCAGSSR